VTQGIDVRARVFLADNQSARTSAWAVLTRDIRMPAVEYVRVSWPVCRMDRHVFGPSLFEIEDALKGGYRGHADRNSMGSSRPRSAFMSSRSVPEPDSVAAAYSTGLTLLSRRELSVRQLHDRLVRRGYTPAAVDGALERLRASRVLDDARVARAFARTRASVKRQGRDRVLRELAAIGIARNIAADAVTEVFGALDEAALLNAALAKRLRRGVTLENPADRRRIIQALLRQGFSMDAIRRAIRETETED